MVAVVQPDAQNLVRTSNRGTNALVAERMHSTRRDALRDNGLEMVHPGFGKKGLIEVSRDVADVDIVLVVNTHDWIFLANGAEAHKFHGGSFVLGEGEFSGNQYVARPPLMSYTAPVEKLTLSELSQAISSATSSGLPTRFIGISSVMY